MVGNNKPSVTGGCWVFTVPFVFVVFVAAFIFGLIFGAPLMQAVVYTLGVLFVLVLVMLGIEVLTGLFHIEPDNDRKAP